MAKAAIIESNQADFPFKKPQLVVKMKRKTPSELREEQLKKRANQKLAEQESQSFKVPKYVNTRVSEVYPVKKSSERCRLQLLKEKTKDSTKDEKANNPSSLPCSNEEISSKDSIFKKTEQCSQSSLRNVIQLHLKDEISTQSTEINMEKAFKGFGVPAVPRVSLSLDPSGRTADVDLPSADTCPTEIIIPGNKSPLDLTLKTSLRLVSSASVKWSQRINASYAFQNCGCQVSTAQKKEEIFSKALCSWIYPQCSLPLSVIFAMESSNAKTEKDFLEKRRQDWEGSFQNLYFMLRKNLCNIFYVYTSEFVALFVGGNINLGEKQKRPCNAYLSKSTRKLRSLLKKHGVSFLMPLSKSTEVEEETEDMAEILEYQRKNLGQAIFSDSFLESDNTAESLLSITGNINVHTLYNFLLNHRFYLNSFNGGDVPVLYSPSPFQNSSISFPEVRCKEMRKADFMVSLDQEDNNGNGFDLNNYNNNNINSNSNNKMCYSIEISNTVIPPWVISGVCHAMSIDGRSFDSIFKTDTSSMGLNIALSETGNKNNTFGIQNSILVPALHSASLKKLKYSNGAYVAFTAE